MSDVPKNTPPDVEPLEPRLSIGHLLVGVACVAIYMSIDRLLADAERSEQGTLDTLMQAASGVFGGLALAGLLLLISRRVRHQKFPRSGGEILWVMRGIAVACVPTVSFFVGAEHGWPSVLETLAHLVIWTTIYTYAILTSRGRWRVCFIVYLSESVVWILTCNSTHYFHGISIIHIIYPCRLLIETFTLALVACLDLRRPDHTYPWPHWTGIILDLTIGFVWSVYFAIYLHSQVLPLAT